ncbi:MAG: 30S ribosomal protein S12 methylthiotransferase RimO, partial [Planctomycetia bacterium]|nr:30S ribosomal protein S12 methylthiotransferase RimO [Planctomycetia bacterium]
RTFSLICLGCPKNLVDAERMAGLLTEAGWKIVREPRGAACVIVNTCGFLEDSRNEAIEHVRQILKYKRNGEVTWIVVTGCLAQRDATKFQLPENVFSGFSGLYEHDDTEGLLTGTEDGVDAIVGVTAREQIVTVLETLEEKRRAQIREMETGGDRETDSFTRERKRVFLGDYPCPINDDRRYRLTPQHVAYLKIAEGCARRCAYCAIPQIRGPHVSKPVGQAVVEARELVASGAREIVLIAQDLTFYGLDWTDESGRTQGPQLATLLRELVKIPDLAWLRLMYLYPMYVTDELIEVIASEPKVLPYLDIPLQHASDAILCRMNRVVNRTRTEDLLAKLRERIPELVLRTTMMVGFPGETDDAFDELCEFVRRWRFERLGAFVFSPEPGTPAYELPVDERVPERVAMERKQKLMKLQSEIAFEWNRRQIGRTVDVILDAPIRGERNTWIGRTAMDAPEVDGVVYVTGDGTPLEQGTITPCEIVSAQGYDLVAVPADGGGE